MRSLGYFVGAAPHRALPPLLLLLTVGFFLAAVAYWQIHSSYYVVADDAEYWYQNLALYQEIRARGLFSVLSSSMDGASFSRGRPTLQFLLGVPFLAASGGDIVRASQLFSFFFSSALAAFLFLLCLEWYKNAALAFLFSLLLLSHPFIFTLGKLFLPELPYLTGLLGGVFFAIRAARKKSASCSFLAALLLAFALGCRPIEFIRICALVLVPAFLLYLWSEGGLSRRHLRNFLLVTGLATILFALAAFLPQPVSMLFAILTAATFLAYSWRELSERRLASFALGIFLTLAFAWLKVFLTGTISWFYLATGFGLENPNTDHYSTPWSGSLGFWLYVLKYYFPVPLIIATILAIFAGPYQSLSNRRLRPIYALSVSAMIIVLFLCSRIPYASTLDGGFHRYFLSEFIALCLALGAVTAALKSRWRWILTALVMVALASQLTVMSHSLFGKFPQLAKLIQNSGFFPAHHYFWVADQGEFTKVDRSTNAISAALREKKGTEKVFLLLLDPYQAGSQNRLAFTLRAMEKNLQYQRHPHWELINNQIWQPNPMSAAFRARKTLNAILVGPFLDSQPPAKQITDFLQAVEDYGKIDRQTLELSQEKYELILY